MSNEKQESVANNALSDALGTDGDATADRKEAESTGRHFVIRPSGDCAKLREAIDYLCERMADMDATFDPSAVECLRAALAAPPRNCDVGTADEQDKRFSYMFCRVGIDGCEKCKLNVLKHRGNTCGIHWAQMPYEEGGIW